MANTTPVYARIDSGLKESAEGILAELGISPSSAIQMLYSQIVLKGRSIAGQGIIIAFHTVYHLGRRSDVFAGGFPPDVRYKTSGSG